MNATVQAIEQELERLRRELDELQKSLPRHSVKASQLMRIEELEEAIREKENQLAALRNP